MLRFYTISNDAAVDVSGNTVTVASVTTTTRADRINCLCRGSWSIIYICLVMFSFHIQPTRKIFWRNICRWKQSVYISCLAYDVSPRHLFCTHITSCRKAKCQLLSQGLLAHDNNLVPVNVCREVPPRIFSFSTAVLV